MSKVNIKNKKHDSSMKMIQELVGQLFKDIELVMEEIEVESYDTGHDAGYAQCEKDNGIKSVNEK